MWLAYWVPPHIPPSASSHDLVHEIGSEIRTNVLRSLTHKPKQEIYCIFIDKGSHTHHYRKGRSTELLLMHLAETWRRAIDKKLVVGAVFIDFQKAFDCVSHSILLHKLEHNFGITGNLLAWIRDYLPDREQYTVINGVPSENTKVAHGIPQGSVLGPILFALYTSDLPFAVNTATTFLYVDDTTMYCVGESVDQVTTTLNKAPEELALWCKHNSLVPHPKKCEGMILKRNHFIGPLGCLKINQHLIKWS